MIKVLMLILGLASATAVYAEEFPRDPGVVAEVNAESSEESKNIDFSMVISGGVSLGAYESGYNWATVRMLAKLKSLESKNHPELRSVAGASAGSINALLTAMYWCQKESVPYRNSVEDNLFYETWVNLGIEDLIIKGKDPENKSTLFTRKELKNKAAQIMEHMGKNIYRNGCEVPMGFAVTKVTPIIEEFQGIKIKNQNFSIPLSFKVKNGKATIVNKKMPEESTAFHLAIPNIEHDYTKIVDVLFASSAFPGAFQQVKLKYKYKGKIRSNYFIDGGAYDNIPLQLATELNSKANLFIFMDPNNMRKEPVLTEKEEEEKPPVGFLTSSASPLSSSVEIFQQMKLYQAINQYFRRNPDRKLILSSRFHPLTAGFLEHFGAFLDINFRMYDYHVGVYDGIYRLAEKLRKKGSFNNKSQFEIMDILMKDLDIDKNKEALTAYNFFKATEFKHTKAKTDNRYAAIYQAFDLKSRDTERYTGAQFKSFLSKLDMRYIPVKKGSFVYNARKDLDHWGKRPLRYIVNRITTLENERAEEYPDHFPIAKSMSIAAWAGGSMLKKKDGWDILPINAPRDKGNESFMTMLRFIPTEFSTETVNGGFSFAYEAYWYRQMSFLDGLDFKASYNFNDNNGDFIRFDADAFSEFDDFVKFGAGASVFGNIEKDFYDSDTAYGANVYIDLMDIFRITYVRRFGDIEDNNYFYLGVENIPSLIYWLNR
jgi:predicted acylesterase/phospholipase RssA